MSDQTAVVVLVVAADDTLRTDLQDELSEVLDGLATVDAVADADAAIRAGRDAIERGGIVPVAFGVVFSAPPKPVCEPNWKASNAKVARASSGLFGSNSCE